MQASQGAGHADDPGNRPAAGNGQGDAGIEALLATARGKAVLGEQQRQAQVAGSQPGEHLGLEVVGVEHHRTAAQEAQQSDQPWAVGAADTRRTKTGQQVGRCLEENHLVAAGNMQAMIQQHALGAIETAAMDEVHHEGSIQCHRQCQSQRREPRR